MAVFIVTWNINKAAGSYNAARDAFVSHLERYQNIKDSGLETVRFISTTNTANQLSDDLRQKLDANDRIVVSSLNVGQHQGWLDQATWEWINARL